MEAKPPISLDEFKKKRREFSPVIKDKTKRSVLDRVAVWITNHVGSMGFFMIIFAWTAIWLSWNMFTPKEARFDPFPGFRAVAFYIKYDPAVFNAPDHDRSECSIPPCRPPRRSRP